MVFIFSDEELLARVGSGDKTAFAELYERYQGRVYRYMLTMVKVPEQAEDLTHGLFLKLWEQGGRWQLREGNFQKYFFRAAYNMGVNGLRDMVREREGRDGLFHFYQYYSEAYYSPQELERFDRLADEALAQLPPQGRRVFELCRKEGKSYKEVADLLGISPNTVREHMVRSLAVLRDFVKSKGEFVLLVLLIERFL